MDHLIRRLQSEFLDMPGLRLTLPQSQRLFGLNATTCRAVLNLLVRAQFLMQRPDGTYARASGGVVQPPTTDADELIACSGDGSTPQEGDVVITGDGTVAPYRVRQVPGAVQFAAVRWERAVHFARGFADTRKVDVWYCAREGCRRVESFRADSDCGVGSLLATSR